MLKEGTIVYNHNPASPEEFSKWKRAPWAGAVPDGPDGGTCLRIQVPAGNQQEDSTGSFAQKDVRGKDIKATAGTFEIKRKLDVESLRGWQVKLRVRVRSSGVSKPAKPWEGVRIGLSCSTAMSAFTSNISDQPQDSDWHVAELPPIRIPEDATNLVVYLGLVATSGTLWVDNIQIEAVAPPWSVLAAERGAFSQTTHWRGANVGNGAESDNSIKKLAGQWNINTVRWWLHLPSPDLPEKEYDDKIEKMLSSMDQVLNQAESIGLKIMPVFNLQFNGWGSMEKGGTHRVYLEQKALDRFLKTWGIVAQRYSGRDGIWGYDILNETVLRVPPAEGLPDWEGLVEKAAAIIHAYDAEARIVIEPEEWYGLQAFLKLGPVKVKNAVYSIHMYAPFELTHQGIDERKSMGISYPSTINGKLWDKNALRQVLRPARDFQLAYGVPMQVGEFSCIRWAPDGSSARWLKDSLDIFEEYGWDYTYHALMEWEGWNPAFGEDPKNMLDLPQPSDAKKVMLEFFGRNLKTSSSEPEKVSAQP